jgi:hypothetical protein
MSGFSFPYKLSFRLPADDVSVLRKAVDQVNTNSPVGELVGFTLDGTTGTVSDITVWYKFHFSVWVLGVTFGQLHESESLAATIGRQLLTERGLQ